ncbi:uncharacterized protein N7446_000312 [Penicillium canescens]|uniref:Major facilitator superfamily (MFS) profile domain-containing protein n=1 Tax=Penicillium canescens TaxID=5083 RepID=A0AAD6N5M7_PENCN|nr:uncharacterized protein N7446_000312 [Penicillium canescens]KAJ6030625.1 hypothetical protein N7460_010891 [Penicillium canescens]KAJ6059660.1 hypothetical protein N7444_003299 [Penicillium canescens]KAJ6077376.1 hypothetical protein N7446_000312 [Penicillium canescens]
MMTEKGPIFEDDGRVGALYHKNTQDELDARINAFTPAEQKKIIRRVDRRLVPIVGFLYCISLLDRNNLGVTNIAGMGTDLALSGTRYSLIALLFYVGYTIFQPIGVVLIRIVGPRIFLSSICLLWGIVMICFGFVKTWSDLIPLRIILGAFEAGLFPGCVYFLSCWYLRYETQERFAGFYVIGSFVSGFSGIIGYGFSQLETHGSGPAWWGQHYGPTEANPNIKPGVLPGIAGWRWIFILYGTITCLVAGVTSIFLVDFPEKTKACFPKFLSEHEVDFLVARIEKERGDVVPEPFHLGTYLRAGLDLKVWAYASLFGLATITVIASVTFLPIILNQGMGFGIVASQCLTAPPYVFACMVILLQGRLGDRYQLRSPLLALNCCGLFVGLALLGYAHAPGVRYFGAFLATAMSQANIPCILAWQANNVRGQWKRAFTSAAVVGAGGLGGIIGSLVFRLRDAPLYRPGIWACMTANGLILLIIPMLLVKFYRANRRSSRGGKLIQQMEGFMYTY